MKEESGTKIAINYFKFSYQAVDNDGNSITRQGIFQYMKKVIP